MIEMIKVNVINIKEVLSNGTSYRQAWACFELYCATFSCQSFYCLVHPVFVVVLTDLLLFFTPELKLILYQKPSINMINRICRDCPILGCVTKYLVNYYRIILSMCIYWIVY